MKVLLKKTRIRFDDPADTTPVTLGVLNAALAKLVSTDLPAVVKSHTDAGFAGVMALLNKKPEEKVVTPPKVEPPKVEDKVLHPDPVIAAKLLTYERDAGDMKKLLEKMQTDKDAADARAEKADRKSAIDSVLSTFNFVKPEGRDLAAQQISSAIERDANGNLIAGGLPLADFTKDFLTVKNDFLLAGPAAGTGSGAQRGAVNYRGSGAAPQIEDIKPGMTEAEIKAVSAQILSVMQ